MNITSKSIHINYDFFMSRETMPAAYLDLMKKAEKATYTAYSPYSNFCVGAAIWLENDTIITGSNQENAAYPSTLCAERTAIYFKGANYANVPIRMMAIAARKAENDIFLPVTPCGSCRQVMLEYEQIQQKNIPLLMPYDNGFVLMHAISDLLPLCFNHDSLKS